MQGSHWSDSVIVRLAGAAHPTIQDLTPLLQGFFGDLGAVLRRNPPREPRGSRLSDSASGRGLPLPSQLLKKWTVVPVPLASSRRYGHQALLPVFLHKLSDALDDEQKRNFLHNLLQEMRREGTIQRLGPKRRARWVLAKP